MAMRGLLLSALLVGACLAVQGRNLQADNNADVIIIGAGMAGITTSNTILAKNPNVKLVILEARDRSGGRLVSQKTKYGEPRHASATLGPPAARIRARAHARSREEPSCRRGALLQLLASPVMPLLTRFGV
jgi:monoamine oxidase